MTPFSFEKNDIYHYLKSFRKIGQNKLIQDFVPTRNNTTYCFGCFGLFWLFWAVLALWAVMAVLASAYLTIAHTDFQLRTHIIKFFYLNLKVTSKIQCYKTFYVWNLQMFVII